MKLFVFGAQCSGKTTLVKYLRKTTSLPVVERDDEVLSLNDGNWPKNDDAKGQEIFGKVIQAALMADDIIFFINHTTVDQAKLFKQAGFSIILLDVKRSELLRRNQQRVEEEGYDDASKWIELQLKDIQELEKHGLIDHVIDGEQSTKLVAEKLIGLTSQNNFV